jgi:outer membrane lipoprotein-sorting protein
MSIFKSRPVLRWGVPVAILMLVVGGGAATRAIAASSSPSRPTPQQLLVDLQSARDQGVSGTVVERADLGLPALPSPSGGDSSDFRSLINGSHTLRVWYSGPTQVRVALLGTLGESDVIRNGKDLWVWDSQKNTATHMVIKHRHCPCAQGSGSAYPSTTPYPSESVSPGTSLSPSESVSPSTSLSPSVSLSPSGLLSPSGTLSPSSLLSPSEMLTPSGTLSASATGGTGFQANPDQTATPSETATPSGSAMPSESVTATPSASAVPSETGSPSASGSPATPQDIANAILAKLQPTTNVTTSGPVTIAGRTAHELVMTPKDTRSLVARVTIAVDSQRHTPLRERIYAVRHPTPAFEWAFTQVNFNRPSPAQFNFAPPSGAIVKESRPHPHAEGAQYERPTVVGKGWTSIVIAKLPPHEAMPQPGASGGGMQIQNLPAVSGNWGSGHLLTSRLFTVLFTDDGRVLAGAVPPQMLYRAAAAK